MPAYAIKDISEAVSLYPMDMIHKAIEKTKKFHKHSFAYTLRILSSWQEEINAGNPEPWNFKNKFSPSDEDNAFGIDLDERDFSSVEETLFVTSLGRVVSDEWAGALADNSYGIVAIL